jgi:predicted transcriptional regulator of viral defense system
MHQSSDIYARIDTPTTKVRFDMPRPLPQRSSPEALLDRWEEKRPFFSAEDVVERVGAEGLREVRNRVRQRRLMRVQRGVYAPHTKGASPAFLLAATMGTRNYYVGGDFALFIHDEMDNAPRRLAVFVESRLRTRRLGKATAVFYASRPDAFEDGIEKHTFDGVAVRISDLERTLLDGLDHPQIFGSLDESLAYLNERLPNLDHENLMDYAARGSKVATCQRLGVLLERLGRVSEVGMDRLMARIPPPPALLPLFLAKGRKGQVNPRWRVLEND